VLEFLKNDLKLKVAMITGDNKHSALKVAKFLEIPEDRVTYRAYPATKKQTVAKF
jgi:cation transport ATPase